MTGKKKLRTCSEWTDPSVPFEDFLIFIFESAGSSPKSLSSSSQRNNPWNDPENLVTTNLKYEEDIQFNIRINRRFSCPDFMIESDTCSIFSSSSSLLDNDNSNNKEKDSYTQDEAPLLPLSVSTTPTESLRLEFLSRDDDVASSEVEENLTNSTDCPSPSRKNEYQGLSKDALSFFKIFSAATRSKSSPYSNVDRSPPVKSRPPTPHNKRFTRSVPSKLNMMTSQLERDSRIWLEEERTLTRSPSPISFGHTEDENDKDEEDQDKDKDKGERKVDEGNTYDRDKVDIRRVQTIDPTDVTLKDENVSMSLFLDAVHLSQQSDDDTSPSYEIFYQY